MAREAFKMLAQLQVVLVGQPHHAAVLVRPPAQLPFGLITLIAIARVPSLQSSCRSSHLACCCCSCCGPSGLVRPSSLIASVRDNTNTHAQTESLRMTRAYVETGAQESHTSVLIYLPLISKGRLRAQAGQSWLLLPRPEAGLAVSTPV